jgi:hypothetical protein
MNISKRDWIFIAIIVAVLGALFASTGRNKTRHVPYDDKHRQFYESIHTGGSRQDAEKRCAACHSAATTPLPASHPPKEQCLVCHTLVKGAR